MWNSLRILWRKGKYYKVIDSLLIFLLFDVTVTKKFFFTNHSETTPEVQSSAVQEENIEKCYEPEKIFWRQKIKPKYQLDPEKFLIPALVWGPMNQGL